MLPEVKPFALDFFGDTQAGDGLGDIHGNHGADAGPDDRGSHSSSLGDQLSADPGRTIARTAKQREVAALLDAGQIEMGEAQLQIEHYWAGALRRAVIDGDVENGSVMAGQSVGMVTKEEPVADIMAELMQECEDALA